MKPKPPTCAACGTPYDAHDGLQRTCQRLQAALKPDPLKAELLALIAQWRAIRARQTSARPTYVGETYEDAENFIASMERLESHARGLGI